MRAGLILNRVALTERGYAIRAILRGALDKCTISLLKVDKSGSKSSVEIEVGRTRNVNFDAYYLTSHSWFLL